MYRQFSVKLQLSNYTKILSMLLAVLHGNSQARQMEQPHLELHLAKKCNYVAILNLTTYHSLRHFQLGSRNKHRSPTPYGHQMGRPQFTIPNTVLTTHAY